jgi:hypothetical protein
VADLQETADKVVSPARAPLGSGTATDRQDFPFHASAIGASEPDR